MRIAVQQAALDQSTFTDEHRRAMASAPAYPDAHCLASRDDQNAAMTAVTGWSAGPGRPGLLEPLGVHCDHRGHGYGTAISAATAAALRKLGSSSAIVCTPSANVGTVNCQRSVEFQPTGPGMCHVRATRQGSLRSVAVSHAHSPTADKDH